VVRNGGVWRDGTRIAVLVGAQMYDLNGNLLGKLTAGDGSMPISLEGKSAQAERAFVLPALSRSITPRSSSEQVRLNLVSVTSENERHAQT
jgi:hypothetical protein